MDIATLVDSKRPESTTLEYKSTDAHIDGILKEIVALANNEGGSVIVGIYEEDGEIIEIGDVKTPSRFEESIQNKLGEDVEPRLEVDFIYHKYNGNRIVEISVPSVELLRSVDLNKPFFPIRQGSTTTYLHGHDLMRLYSGTTPNLEFSSGGTETESDSDLLDILKGINTNSTREQALLLLHYAEMYENGESTSNSQWRQLFQRARIQPPTEITLIARNLAEDGYIMPDGDSTWRLTMEGIQRAEELESDSEESSETKKSRSLQEYFVQASDATKRDAALIVGWYLEYQEDQSNFIKSEVENQARDAKVSLGANVSRDLSKQINEGHLMKVDKRDGQDAYHLTLTGEEYVERELLAVEE